MLCLTVCAHCLLSLAAQLFHLHSVSSTACKADCVSPMTNGRLSEHPKLAPRLQLDGETLEDNHAGERKKQVVINSKHEQNRQISL
eukprot:4656779-Amphidinium_carterae.1